MVNLARSIVGEQFVTGFAEGDGHVGLKGGYNTPEVSFSQREEDVLSYISKVFTAGRLYQPYNPCDNWRLFYHGNNCREILKALAKHVVGQAFLSGLNDALVRVGLPPTITHEPSTAWLAGFWYADGTSSSTSAFFHLTLAQKDPDVLNAIQKAFGGKVYRTTRNFHHWKPEANTRVGLALEFLKYPHASSKAERLRRNLILTGHLHPRNEIEEHESRKLKEKVKTQRREHWSSYSRQHEAQREERKRVRAYIKTHPEILDRSQA